MAADRGPQRTDPEHQVRGIVLSGARGQDPLSGDPGLLGQP